MNSRTAPWRFERFDLASRKLVEGVTVPEQAWAANKSHYIRPLESAGIPPGVIILDSIFGRCIRGDRKGPC